MVLYKEARRYTIDPRQYCEILAARARKGEDFEKLVALFDHRNLKTVDGAGEEKGKIYPPEVEPTVLAMNPGEVNIVEMESCFHIVRVVERTHVGLRPFTDLKLQLEIHKRLEFEIGESEYRKLADGLWAKGQPTILIDLEK
jgi:parvulin-like peptidyl-prolyl isomerase